MLAAVDRTVRVPVLGRAESLKKALLQQGVPEDRVKTISYGKEKPFCTEENDQCWQQNRVEHVAMAR